jgi:hypothetical protein
MKKRKGKEDKVKRGIDLASGLAVVQRRDESKANI